MKDQKQIYNLKIKIRQILFKLIYRNTKTKPSEKNTEKPDNKFQIK